MELRHLRYFVALAERLNFTYAAEKVHVTQSTLSHQIKQLEDELGQPLFERTGKRVTMTEAGEMFLAHVTSALKDIESGIGMLKKASNLLTGEVRIGATQTFCIGLIPACLATFLSKHPAVKVVVEELSAAAIDKRLRSSDLDIGIAYRPNELNNLWFEPLYNEEMVLVVSDLHPMAKRKRIRMVELHHQHVVLLTKDFATRQMLDECFRSAGAEPTVVAETNTITPMLGLVRGTRIAAIVSENLAAGMEGLHVVPIENPTPIRTPGLLWKRNAPKSIAVRSFAAIIRRATIDAKIRKLHR